MKVQIRPHATEAYELLAVHRRRTLVSPEDDMWATFADQADPYALTFGEQLVGRFSVDQDNQLHAFYVDADHEAIADQLFVRVLDEIDISAAMASTVDPTFLSLSLAAGGRAQPVALMYDHIAQPGSAEPVELRVAATEDHAAAVAFDCGATGSPEGFLMPYVAERIERRELYLVEADGTIVATGECREDTRAPGNAHLGLVVGAELRGQGMGTRLMHTLTELCIERGMTPRCSTEPANVAAQTVIRRAGFRNRHRVFRVAMARGKTPAS
ncbi:GNAT family N-acetyltransferase [Nocardioides dilutus]